MYNIFNGFLGILLDRLANEGMKPSKLLHHIEQEPPTTGPPTGTSFTPPWWKKVGDQWSKPLSQHEDGQHESALEVKHLNLPLVVGRSTYNTPNTRYLPPGHSLTASDGTAKCHHRVGSAHIWDSLASRLAELQEVGTCHPSLFMSVA